MVEGMTPPEQEKHVAALVFEPVRYLRRIDNVNNIFFICRLRELQLK